MPLVHAISVRLAAELPSSIRMEDLESAGTFGLMDAIERYDPDVGARFETYCATRIRGAMLDELRNLNWVPRTRSARAGKIAAAVHVLRGELGRNPTPQEIASKSGLRLQDVNAAPWPGRQPLSLSAEAAGADGNAARHMDVLAARSVCNPVELLQEKERRDTLAAEIRRLPQAERLVIVLYYFEELTMRQIGEVLNVTESRVCQMHTAILTRLQQRLADLDESRPGT